MYDNGSPVIPGARRAFFVLLLIFTVSLACITPQEVFQDTNATEVIPPTADPGVVSTQVVIPTLPAVPEQPEATPEIPETGGGFDAAPDNLSRLYEQTNPGVVNIQVFITQGRTTGTGVGSGFILDEAGHVVTNHHVVAGAGQVIVIFYNGIETTAEVVGVDENSDLAILRVNQLPEGSHPLPLGDSDQAVVGEWVIAIGNPFGRGSSMSTGIVSAVGRTIPAGATPFSIPQAIQTDAAINPGNSGGPLINLNGEVIGVNAMIQTGSSVPVGSGVGFAIPSNTVRRVAPVLMEQGVFHWPWLGIQGESVNLLVMQANNLETQQGAYIHEVVSGSPAERAGLQGSTNTVSINGVSIPVGGDVVTEADGQPVIDLNDLLVLIASKNPGETMQLNILRNGQPQMVTAELEPRPQEFEDTQVFPFRP